MSENPADNSPSQLRVIMRTGALGRRLMERPGTPAVVAKRDLIRYYVLLDECLADVDLTKSEASLLIEAAAGLRDLDERLGSVIHRYLWAEVAESIREQRLGEPWAVEDAHGAPV